MDHVNTSNCKLVISFLFRTSTWSCTPARIIFPVINYIVINIFCSFFLSTYLKTSIDNNHCIQSINFKHAFLTSKDVIDRLLALSQELRDAYRFYQDVLFALHTADTEELCQLLYPDTCSVQYKHLPSNMKKARQTLRKHYDEILNIFKYGFSNGAIEGINNKIKVMKRTAYVFRKFHLCILISFKNSFYSMNYKTKAANPKLELAA